MISIFVLGQVNYPVAKNLASFWIPMPDPGFPPPVFAHKCQAFVACTFYWELVAASIMSLAASFG